MAFTIMLGWLLWVGRPILLPIPFGAIAVYILSAAAAALGRAPVVGRAPLWARRALALAVFASAVGLLATLMLSSLARVVAALPGYESNLDALVTRLATLAGVEGVPT